MDVAVVGGGLVGMATAVRLVREGLEVGVFEQERALGMHQSGHNSNVIHSGAFYEPGSLKAQLAVRGRAMLEDFVQEHRLPLERVGKLVVQQRGEDRRFDELAARASANGVAHEVLGSPSAIRDVAEQVTGERALWLPDVAITDFRSILEALADEVRAGGGDFSLQARGYLSHGRLIAKDRYVDVRHVVFATGAGFNRLRVGAPQWRVIGFRGSYRALERPDIGRLVYGVPDPRYPFLGVHVTPTLSGGALVGPNATLTRPLAGRALFLAMRNVRAGLRELRGRRHARMERAVRRYLPDASVGREVVESGVRAQAVDRWGRFADDFVVVEEPGVTWVANTPSPAATACLAIGEHLASRVIERL